MTEEPDAGKPHVRICMGGMVRAIFLPLQKFEIKMSISIREKLLSLTEARFEHMALAGRTFDASIDPLGVLLRVHLLSESILEELIRISFEEKADAVLSLGLTYKNKLDLVSKLEIDEDWPLLNSDMVGSLRKLNSLRNKLAHQLNAELNNEQVIGLFMNQEQVYGDMSESDIHVNLKRYMFFILGNMLPKYEKIEEESTI